jgi:hypothetical protein
LARKTRLNTDGDGKRTLVILTRTITQRDSTRALARQSCRITDGDGIRTLIIFTRIAPNMHRA